MYASIFDPLARLFAAPFTAFYAVTGDYALSILLITICVMILTTPLTLKQTKGMLEMQKLQPEVRRLQQQYRGDRQTLNQEMMKLYQEHKVNPLASCFPLLLQMPVFIGMFTLLRGLTRNTDKSTGHFVPKYISEKSRLFKDLSQSSKMNSLGLDLAKSPAKMFEASVGRGVLYVGFVALLAVMYWVQQRMIANRSAAPTMSETQAKVMQYLPVGFAAFQILFPLGLVVYYMAQTVLRIGQQQYITKRFYHGEGSLGHQAQAASAQAREQAKADKSSRASAGASAGRAGPATRATGPSRPQPRGATPPKGRPMPERRTPAKPLPRTTAKAPPKPIAKGGGAKPVSKPARPVAAPPARPVKPSATKPTRPVKPQRPQNPQA